MTQTKVESIPPKNYISELGKLFTKKEDNSKLEIPKLEDYDMNPKTGFLPATPPLKRLSDIYYEPWETLIADMKDLLLCGKYRNRILQLKVLSIDKLINLKEYQRAFSILTFLQHSFIWGKNEPVSQALPECIAVPLVQISEKLGINPVSCNAAVVLWNWKLIDEEEEVDLNNLSTLSSFTGSLDEAWFYLITVAIEAKGGIALSSIINTLNYIKSIDTQNVIIELKKMAASIKGMTELLDRMYEKCDPYLFYWKLRPYLAGWENMSEAGLPHGILYKGVDDIDRKVGDPIQFRQYAGGSAAQSALIQVLDIALGIVHYPTNSEWQKMKEKGEIKKSSETYLYSMRAYMPGLHRKFLEDLALVSNIKEFVERNGGECAEAYNECVLNLKEFRDQHIKIVTRYIIVPARKGPSIGSFTIDSEHTIKPDNLRKDSIISSLVNPNPNSSTNILDSIPENDTKGSTRSSSPISIINVNNSSNGISQSPTSNSSNPNSFVRESPRLRSGTGSGSVDLSYPQLANSANKLTRKNSAKFNLEFGLARSKASAESDSDTFRGTGGTDLIPFLKQVRDETTDSVINDPNILFPPL
ncbi:IDO-domain-containing protein [Neoconidiobolus thromboides FSU 785]|nr:IDO-domain-containing protein [Neoconidiobolus thromboides FSU 785]